MGKRRQTTSDDREVFFIMLCRKGIEHSIFKSCLTSCHYNLCHYIICCVFISETWRFIDFSCNISTLQFLRHEYFRYINIFPVVFKNAIIKTVSTPPICQNRWTRRFPNHNFKLKHIWNALPDCTKEARLISLNWKIIHNIYPTKLWLHKSSI